MKIFLKTNHRFTGIHRSLESFNIFDKEVILVDNIEDTNKYEDEVGVFGGFVPFELKHNKTIKKKYYVFCSPFGQADLSGPSFYSPEICLLGELHWSVKNKDITGVLSQSESLSSRFDWVTYLPPATKLWKYDRGMAVLDRKNYGFLGNNSRKHKNVMNQVAAISRLKPKEDIVVRNAAMWSHLKGLFDCNFKDAGGLNDEDYYNEIMSHRLCFQCSWSEAFDYQAFEYLVAGVPVIASPCLNWIYEYFPTSLSSHLIVENIDDWRDIFKKAQYLLLKEGLYEEVSGMVSEAANDHNQRNIYLLEELCNELSS